MARATLLPAVVAVLAAFVLGAAAASASRARPDVVLVTRDCSEHNFICGPFRRALRVTGARGHIISPENLREDPADTLAFLAGAGHDLVMTDFNFIPGLNAVVPRFPHTRFGFVDAPMGILDRRLANVAAVIIRPAQGAYLAGWLAARMENRRRRGPDVIGVVGGESIPPVDDFVTAYIAGARHAVPGVVVLTGYSNDFTDPTKCEAIARDQIARGAGVVFDVAGGCGPGTLRAARRAGVWAIGVDSDQSYRGPFVLTSVVKRYDRIFTTMIRGVKDGTLRYGRTTQLALRQGGVELGRISPRVPVSLRRGLLAVRRDILRGRIDVPQSSLPRN